MAPRKVDYALAQRDAITAFAEAAERIAELDAIYKNSGYDGGGSDPIDDDDLISFDITAQNLANASTFAVNLALFLNNGVPLVFDYASAINAFRGM
jgi:hypothetical protein